MLSSNCTPVGRASDLMIGPDLKLYILVCWAGASCLLLDPPEFNWCFLLHRIFSDVV